MQKIAISAIFLSLLSADGGEIKAVGNLLVDYDNKKEIVYVKTNHWDPDKLLTELRNLHSTHPFHELELVTVDPTPELIAFISTITELTHLTIGTPPEGVFIKDKAILKILRRLTNLKEISFCVDGLRYRDISFLEDMESIWKVTILKRG